MQVKAELTNKEISEQLEITLQNVDAYTPEQNTRRVLEQIIPEQLKTVELFVKLGHAIDEVMRVKNRED